MNIGIFLPMYSPKSGGATTFINTLVNGILHSEKFSSSGYKFIIFCGEEQYAFFSLISLPESIEVCKIKKKSSVDKALTFLMFNSTLFRAVYKYSGPVEIASREKNVDLLWCVGEGMQEVPDLPYIATVWDLQHRLHPFFPEVSRKTIWTRREEYNKYYLRRSTYTVVGTQTGANEIISIYGLNPLFLRVIPMPAPDVNVSQMKGCIKNSSDELADKNFILYPAQFWPHKNHVNLLQALSYLRDRYQIEIPLYLTGSDKGNLSYIKECVDNLRLTRQVKFLGFVSTHDLANLYKKAEVLVYITYFGPDNLPPLEAFCFGCPVIASNIPGALEQYRDAALLIDPSNPIEIAEAIKKVLTDEALRENLKAAGRRRVDSLGGHEYLDNMLEIFEEYSNIRRCWR